MKDNIREAVFNLVGGYIKGKAAFDLFAGTGAMGLDKIIEDNARSLDENLKVKVSAGDSFFWCRQFLKQSDTWPTEPWFVMCCPPYDFYVDRWDELNTMISGLVDAAPAESVFLVESDNRFDPVLLPQNEDWDVRHYTPARVAVLKKDFPQWSELEQSDES